MTPLHQYVGIILALAFLVLFFWGALAWFRNRDPGRGFWIILTGAQVGLGLLVLTGVVLFAMGGRQPFLHYAYGGFPVLVLYVAHRFAGRFEGLEWGLFAIAGLVNFGLLARGFMTGLGI